MKGGFLVSVNNVDQKELIRKYTINEYIVYEKIDI